MNFQLLPNIIFVCALAGIVLLIARHLPKAVEQSKQGEDAAHENLVQKGLPLQEISRVKFYSRLVGKKAWNFLLEAKDLKPAGVAGNKLRKIFKEQLPAAAMRAIKSVPKRDDRTEEHFLQRIKKDPHNLGHYFELGKFYLDKEIYGDARDVFGYLTQHQPANSEYQARLAFSYYKLAAYAKAVDHYQKSIALDSTQPSRYYNLGRSLEAVGNLESAIRAFEHAINLEPQNSKYYVSLSSVFMKLQDSLRAREALLKAKKLDPENKTVEERLEKI